MGSAGTVADFTFTKSALSSKFARFPEEVGIGISNSNWQHNGEFTSIQISS